MHSRSFHVDHLVDHFAPCDPLPCGVEQYDHIGNVFSSLLAVSCPCPRCTNLHRTKLCICSKERSTCLSLRTTCFLVHAVHMHAATLVNSGALMTVAYGWQQPPILCCNHEKSWCLYRWRLRRTDNVPDGDACTFLGSRWHELALFLYKNETVAGVLLL
jgi:hypothetical protein